MRRALVAAVLSSGFFGAVAEAKPFLVETTRDGHQTVKTYLTQKNGLVKVTSNRWGTVTVEGAHHKITNDSMESGVRYDRSHVRSVEDKRTGRLTEVSFPRPVPDRLRDQGLPAGPGEPLFVDGKPPRTVTSASGTAYTVRDGKWGDVGVEGPRYRVVNRDPKSGMRYDRTYVRSLHDKVDGKLTEVSYPAQRPMRVSRRPMRNAQGVDIGMDIVTYGVPGSDGVDMIVPRASTQVEPTYDHPDRRAQ